MKKGNRKKFRNRRFFKGLSTISPSFARLVLEYAKAEKVTVQSHDGKEAKANRLRAIEERLEQKYVGFSDAQKLALSELVAREEEIGA